MNNIRRTFPVATALVLLFATVLGPLLSTARAADRAGEWAQVVNVVAPHMVRVQNVDGETYVVWHIGLIGPPATNTDEALYAQGVQAHTDLLPPGSSVWVEPEPGVVDPDPGVRLRHVFTASDLETPVGAGLLRSGWVRVYPNARHAYTEVYASQQAEAVLAGAGAWRYSDASTVFVPSAASSGGLPASPRVVPALKTLDADPVGHQVLLDVNRFPPTVEVQPLPPSALAHFDHRMYSIQLLPGLRAAEPEALAAEVLHELTHAQQLIRENTSGEIVDCYASELEAASVSARYWSSLYGPGGKPRLTSSLDAWLNSILAMYVTGELENSVHSRYYEQCEEPDSYTGP